MAVLDERMHSTGNQIDAGHQGHRAVALVLVVPLRGGVDAANRREIRLGIADRLNTGFLIIGEDGDFARAIALRGAVRRISTWIRPSGSLDSERKDALCQAAPHTGSNPAPASGESGANRTSSRKNARVDS